MAEELPADNAGPSPEGAPDETVDTATADNGEPVSMDQARAAVATLLARAGVQRVICVDDDFAGEVSDLTAACDTLLASADPDYEACGRLPYLDEVDFTAAEEVWKQQVNERWDQLAPTDRGLVLAEARQSAGLLVEGEELNAGALKSLLPEDIEFMALTPSDWQTSRTQLIGDAVHFQTLVLFDLNLGDGPTGLQLAVHLYDDDSTNRTWAGVFTHTVAPEDEGAQWETMSSMPGIRRDRFILLSKKHLDNPKTLPHAIKLTLISKPASDLRRLVAEEISGSVNQALEDLSQLSAPEFERIVFGASREEGLWEPDTLLRLFNACLRDTVRARLHTSNEVRDLADRLRSLAEVHSTPTTPSETARRIYRREVYDLPAHLNSVHLPIDLGDIFKSESGTSFILVDQPCDLMVRSNGRRAPDRQFTVVLQISLDDKWSSRSEGFALPAFTESADPAWVMLNRPRMVPIESLDFCAFDDQGRSLAPLLGQPPAWLWPSWRARHKLLAEHANQAKVALEAGQPKQRVAESFYGVRGTCPFKLVVNEDRLRFGVTRVGRLLNPYARALLSRYSAQLARDAFERPFA